MSGKTAELPHRLCCVFPNHEPKVIYEEYGPHLWLLLFMGDVILYWNAFKCAPHTQAEPVNDYILKITTCSDSSFLGHQKWVVGNGIEVYFHFMRKFFLIHSRTSLWPTRNAPFRAKRL